MRKKQEIPEQEIPKIEDQETANLKEKKEKKKEKEKKESKILSLQEELKEAKDKYLRLYSEFENFRRRTTKERLDLISSANKQLMEELIPVIDDFERAINTTIAEETMENWKEGISLIQNKFIKCLEKKGLKKMSVNKGDKFDDEKQEAITQVPAEKKLDGKVIEVVEAGYTLGEHVVRFAKVVVGTKQ